MNHKNRTKKIVASVLAFSLLSTAVISTDSSPLKKLIPTNTISASAAKISGNWEYEEISRYTARITRYTGEESYVLIPESINGHTVKELGKKVFAENTCIKTVSIPRGVSVIPKEAFIRCSNLKTVNIPSSVTSIEADAFRSTAIETIYLPSSLKELGSGAFYLCSNLKTVNIPSCEIIKDRAFMQCPQLTSITLPSNLRYAGEQLFERTPITNIKLTNRDASSFSCAEYAFAGWDLTNMNVPNAEIFGVLLRDKAIRGTRNLTNINGSPLVQYTSSRFGPYTCPYIRSDYYYQIQKYLDKADACRTGFFEQYLDAEIGYIVMEQTCWCRTDGQKIKALHDWLCRQVDYDWLAPNVENHALYNHVDSSAFFRNKTICDGYARAMKLLLDRAGIEAYFTTSGTHAWVIVKQGDYYFHLDACHDDDPDGIGYDHFLKSDSDIQRCTHGHSSWEVSTAINANYPASRITLPREGTPVCEHSMGDANRDGSVNEADAVLIEGILSGRPSSRWFDGTLADADLDGELTQNDADMIREIAEKY
ncbi:MAG: leucine-rich repeat protein [Ruminococcus sp.]|nr:leucine-rich repeat protein [Ruminococcus sp.]